MEPKQDSYPVFEANQVLTSAHLNEAFDYLDEQQRLTRADLIGVGIECGLTFSVDGGQNPVVHLRKGCGTTSLGYLIVEPEDVDLVAYKDYKVPPDIAYPAFTKDSTGNYPFWELLPPGEPGATALEEGFLKDKAVLLFLELKKQVLRNCSPNNCDDRGADVTATVRRLLVLRTDLEAIIAAAEHLKSSAPADIESASPEQLDLSVLRIPRFDVPNSSPAETAAVWMAFLDVFRKSKLVTQTGAALSAAYAAFQPLLEDIAASDPFADFMTKFGFLEQAPATSDQVRFLPYYYDFFDDVIRAYNEFCGKGAELACSCCPDDSLFPRHLMLGAVSPPSGVSPAIYRQQFVGSGAASCCGEQTDALRESFQRLVEMVAQFTVDPLAQQQGGGVSFVTRQAVFFDPQIRITPSVLGDAPLADKAIPYYYKLNGAPPLYRLWNRSKTRRNQANQNLAYGADEYVPVAPDFVRNPLAYDLEPHNFLRVEGHLGKDYSIVMRTLLQLKSQYRLPIEIIALRSGVYDENMYVDLSKESCRFEDLEALYAALREELLSNLCEGTRYFYSLPIKDSKLPGGKPKLPLLQKYAPNYTYPSASVGAWCEENLSGLQSRPYIDVDQNNVDKNAVLTVYCQLFAGTSAPPAENQPEVVAIYYLFKLAEIMPDTIDALAYADFENKYQDLLALVRYFRGDGKNSIAQDFKQFIPTDDLIDHFDEILFSCKLDPIRAIHDEYVRRVGDLRKKQFLSEFLQDNPGIQHKAGVPLGGTFIVVYHQNPSPPQNQGSSATGGGTVVARPTGNFVAYPLKAEKVQFGASGQSGASGQTGTSGQTGATMDQYALVADTNALNATLSRIVTSGSGQVSKSEMGVLSNYLKNIQFSGARRNPVLPNDPAAKAISGAVDGLADGTVIADFFLPYLCCTGCEAVQFVLPPIPLTFTTQVACTDSATGNAAVTVTPIGGVSPFSVAIDGQGAVPLSAPITLAQGDHTLKLADAEGAESAIQHITVQPPLAIGAETYSLDKAANTYRIEFAVTGGTAPYTSKFGTFSGVNFTSNPVAGGTSIQVIVSDKAGCSVSKTFKHNVVLPAFELKPGCANSDNVAALVIKPAGGTAPYSASVDGAPYAPLQDIQGKLYKVGSHKVMLRDVEGTESLEQAVDINPPLQIGQQTAGPGGSATVVVSGGYPPYTVEGKDDSGKSYVLKSGDGKSYVLPVLPLTVQAEDANGCTAPPQKFVQPPA